MKLRDKAAGSLFGVSIEEDSHFYRGTGQTRGLLMISQELEEFASGVLAKERAAAKKRVESCAKNDQARRPPAARRNDRAWREGVGRPSRGISPAG